MFVPKLVTTLRTYSRDQFLADVGAGFIVGIVALPLAVAFAIASGVTPERGLHTAIVAGFLTSALGGSRVQLGGPAGAFVLGLSMGAVPAEFPEKWAAYARQRHTVNPHAVLVAGLALTLIVVWRRVSRGVPGPVRRADPHDGARSPPEPAGGGDREPLRADRREPAAARPARRVLRDGHRTRRPGVHHRAPRGYRVTPLRGRRAMHSTGLTAPRDVVGRFRRAGARVILAGVHAQPMVALERSGLAGDVGRENLVGSLEEALDLARAHLGLAPPTEPAAVPLATQGRA